MPRRFESLQRLRVVRDQHGVWTKAWDGVCAEMGAFQKPEKVALSFKWRDYTSKPTKIYCIYIYISYCIYCMYIA